jgi:allophanate hydrolase
MKMSRETEPLTIAQWRLLAEDPAALRAALLARTQQRPEADPAWIHRATAAQVEAQLQSLAERRTSGAADLLPLAGVPIAVKDNIDVAGWPTTAACPDFAYLAERDATVVARLRAAGAVIIGKTNLDQFATGLVGTRSPHGAVPNTFDPRYISGGSSSGSASVVARGLLPVALGTDTAGSGRVPAGFNNIVGLKPTRGLLPTTGVVPACRTLDCVSVFALTVGDAALVAQIAAGPDDEDAYARARPADAPVAMRPAPRIAIPAAPEFFDDSRACDAWDAALSALRAAGATLHVVDFAPFATLASLLYEGPWVVERRFALRGLPPEARLDPVVRGIILGAGELSAEAAFAAEYRRASLQMQIHAALAGFDALAVPTTPTHYRIEDIARDPVATNSRLGTYTNFANLADLCALALPAPFREDGLPAGLTLLGLPWHDEALQDFGQRWERALGLPLGATGRHAGPGSLPLPAACLRLAVVGAHLSGLPLNGQLLERGARFAGATRTAARYRLYELQGARPRKPGLVRTDSRGAAIEVELWDLPLGGWGTFIAGVPPPLAIGSVELADGTWVKGFLCEHAAVVGARDITAAGGWRAWLQTTP